MGQLLANQFESGNVNLENQTVKIGSLAWQEHPKFKGVSLKTLVKGEATNGLVSCHLVRILPGHEIGEHLHEGRIELHEIVAGAGNCILGGQTIRYQPGEVTVIPADLIHRVVAGEPGLIILAKFLPALE
ncbi:MAG TPA: cupin domain-containing protein [Bacillota bacterium]|jgi:quercetin dioxygenase-like cupin family protein|nr:cupin domain-containing protein [Bacillota bacterium]HOL08858.1 cupin domain-containing protein [Bacillota bacterium]HPO96551.1 cupin domain-containing protein [Bacillota bacterium]